MKSKSLNNKSILITGGTGSLGKKLVQIILSEHKPERLIIFSRDELKQFEMAQKWDPRKYPCLRYMIGDVRDKDRLKMAFNNVDYVIHAAALKHVPKGEYDPEEFVKTNVIGAMNIIDAALDRNVKKVAALSTDKACNPINLYGATKLCSDKLFTAANVYSGDRGTQFSVVRYGNVLGSRGSVVPFFKERVQTGVLPVTDGQMTRFWITLGQAAHFVLESLEKSRGGEIFVPRIPSMKIVDLAKAIGPECKIDIVGIRPGEKIHEILISEDEARSTVQFQECFVVQANQQLQESLFSKRSNIRGQLCPPGFQYSSGTNTQWLSANELREFVDQIVDDYAIEKSRWVMSDIPEEAMAG